MRVGIRGGDSRGRDRFPWPGLRLPKHRVFRGTDTILGREVAIKALHQQFTPAEQASGAVNQIDARSDVFSLGAVLAVILMGRFRRSPVERRKRPA